MDGERKVGIGREVEKYGMGGKRVERSPGYRPLGSFFWHRLLGWRIPSQEDSVPFRHHHHPSSVYIRLNYIDF
jgi:hypothetical protein